MSGVYIKGLELPKNCFICEFMLHHKHDKKVFCVATKPWLDISDTLCDRRHEDCPLIPVPDHGELIDREKLYEQTANWEAQALDQVLKYRPEENKDRWILWSAVRTERSAFKFAVEDAPTIIPADKESDNENHCRQDSGKPR